METKTMQEYKRWCSSNLVDDEMKKVLLQMAGDEEAIKMHFGASLAFGTAGLRGTMGPGTNNMNEFTVGRATRGLAEYILKKGGGAVAIAYDTRSYSAAFAEISAMVLAACGIHSYLFDGPRPTPELSFALRHFGCIAGINITASHNPKTDNGYKAYWSDGAQLGPKEADAVAGFMNKTDPFAVTRMDYREAVDQGLITVIGSDIDEAYLAEVLKQRVNPDVVLSEKDMKIVYTPLHGTGRILVPEVLRRAGFKDENIITVSAQMDSDGSFPTVTYPNPEFSEAFALGIELARENDCDLIIATDPDADRTGIMIRSGDDYVGLTGNQVGCLLLDYIIGSYYRGEQGKVPADAYVVKSIVTTELASVICRTNRVKIYDVLTGFKFIGEVIKKHEKKGKGTFLLGFEESYGYLKGTYARDKDAVVASLLIAEMAAYYRAHGMTLKNAIDSLYARYGSFGESVKSIMMEGADGKEKMAALMENLRKNTPDTLAGEKVLEVRDYLNGTITDTVTGKVKKTGLPSSNVLYYTMPSSVIVIRPSGTEPKIKLYFMAKGSNDAEVARRLDACREAAEGLLRADS